MFTTRLASPGHRTAGVWRPYPTKSRTGPFIARPPGPTWLPVPWHIPSSTVISCCASIGTRPADLHTGAPSRTTGPGRIRGPRRSASGRGLLPGGVTHDVRLAEPFPLAVAHAAGSRKWDLDGHELVCYVMGHGSLLAGHSHPEVVDAVREQAARSFHPGACHELESDWAQAVIRLVPSAE